MTRLTGGGYPKFVERVRTVTTPGSDVDLAVSERGIAVNPQRGELAGMLARAGLPVVGIDQLIEEAAAQAERKPVPRQGPEVAVVQRRTGEQLDTILGA